jgi:hypothetical protein
VTNLQQNLPGAHGNKGNAVELCKGASSLQFAFLPYKALDHGHVEIINKMLSSEHSLSSIRGLTITKVISLS